MNWPVAFHIVEVVKPFVDKITPEIVAILRSDDVMWKYWVLVLIKQTNDPLILAELERIAKSPSLGEVENEVDIEAIAILNGEYK